MLRRGLLITAVVVVSTATVGIFINYATVTRPAWLTADPWRPWLFLILAVLIAVILALFAYFPTGGSTTVQVHPPARLPQFLTAPSSLAPLRVDPNHVLGREVELRQLARFLAKPTKLQKLTQFLARRSEAHDRFVVVAGTGGIGKTTLAAAAAAAALQGGWRVMWLRCRNVEGPDSLAARMVEAARVLGLPIDQVSVAQQCGFSLADLVWGHLNATSGWVLVIDDLDQPSAVALAGDRIADYRGWIRPSRTGLLLERRRLGPPSLCARQRVPAASRAQAPAGTPGLGRPTVAIRCAESGDLKPQVPSLCHPSWLVRRSKRLRGSGREEHYALLRTWLKCQSLRVQGALVTSRDQGITTWGPAAELIRLGPLDTEVGAEVLLAAAPQGGTVEEALVLAERLGGLPLALWAACAVVGEPAGALRSFAAYQQALASRSHSVLPDLPARPDLTNQEIARSLVGHTWELSLDQLDAEGFGMARPLLRLLALFAEAPIPRSLLTTQLVRQVLGVDVSAAALDGALAGLRRYGLVETPDLTRTRKIATLALHPLVRETSILFLEQTTDPQPWRESLSSCLIEQVSQIADAGRSGLDTARLLTPHLLQLIGLQSENLDTFRPARDALNTLAKQLRQAGAYAAALGLHQRCLDAEELVLGAKHPDTLHSSNNLANALYGLGEYQRAAELHELTLAVREEVLGAEDPDTLKSRNNLANALYGLGEYQRAAELHELTLAVREEVLGAEDPDTLKSRNNLANALYGLGEYQRAAELYELTLTIRQRVLNIDHPDTLNSRNNLANALHSLGECRRAAVLHELTLTSRQQVLGVEHPDTLKSCTNLAIALSGLGEYQGYQRAAQLHEQTLAIRERVLGAEHPDTVGSRNNLAEALSDLGKYQRAAQLHKQSLAILERVLGVAHPDTLKSRDNFAESLRRAKGERRRLWWTRRWFSTAKRRSGQTATATSSDPD